MDNGVLLNQRGTEPRNEARNEADCVLPQYKKGFSVKKYILIKKNITKYTVL